MSDMPVSPEVALHILLGRLDREGNISEALSAIKQYRDEITREHIRSMICIVSAAGGKVLVLPKDMIDAPAMVLHKYEDPLTGSLVFSVTKA